MAEDKAEKPKASLSGEAEIIRSVARAFAILNCLNTDRPSATLMELSKEAGFPVSTTQRLINTLTVIGMLRRQKDGRYTFGIDLVRISVCALKSQQLYDLVQAPLERLASETGETAGFAVANGGDGAIYLRQVTSPKAMHHAGWLGRTVPGKGTAIGTALYGTMPQAGFCATRKTVEEGVTAIASPIVGPGGDVVGAINIVGPTFRISDEDIERIGALLVKETASVSAQIGGNIPSGKRD